MSRLFLFLLVVACGCVPAADYCLEGEEFRDARCVELSDEEKANRLIINDAGLCGKLGCEDAGRQRLGFDRFRDAGSRDAGQATDAAATDAGAGYSNDGGDGGDASNREYMDAAYEGDARSEYVDASYPDYSSSDAGDAGDAH